jgi:hypothetical protein
MMRFTYAVFMFVLFACVARAQDTLILKSGVEIDGRIISTSASEVLYMHIDSVGVPETDTLLKKYLFEIKYGDGSKYIMPLLTESEIRRTVQDSIERDKKLRDQYERYTSIASKRYKKGRVLTFVGGGLFVVGATGIIAGVYDMGHRTRPVNDTLIRDAYLSPFLLIGSLVAGAGAIMLSVGIPGWATVKKYRRKANEIGGQLAFTPLLIPETQGAAHAGLAMQITF